MRSLTPAHRRVLETLRVAGARGLSSEELIAASGLNRNTAPRLTELAQVGLVVSSGETRLTTAGKPATVWRLASVAPPGAGLVVVRHVAGPVIRTRGGGLMQLCTVARPVFKEEQARR